MPRPWLLVLLAVAGLVPMLGRLGLPGLHPDEALYASWALRIADGSDPALLGVLVDKPPLLPYLLAGLFRLAGVAPGVLVDPERLTLLARLPGLGAGLLNLFLVYAIVHRVYRTERDREGMAFLAAAFLALSPLAFSLSPTLFTDPLLLLWMLLGLWAALDRHSWLAGLACGLAVATKQQALLVVPLVVAVYWLASSGSPDQRRTPLGEAARLASGFLLPFAVVLWWDSLRWQWLPSFWERSATTYGGIALVAFPELIERARAWAALLSGTAGSPLLLLALLAGLPWLVGRAWKRRGTQAGRFELLSLGWSAGYLLLHLVTTLEPWDRYALPLAPVLAIFLARLLVGLKGAAAGGGDRRWPAGGWGLPAVLLLLVLHGGWMAAAGPYPFGDARAYDRVPQLAAYLRQQPPGTVLHERWLGWHLRFYLHDVPLDQRWWETPERLAADAVAADREGHVQLLALPAGRDLESAQAALAQAGFHLVPRLNLRHDDGSPSLALFRVAPAAAGGANHGP